MRARQLLLLAVVLVGVIYGPRLATPFMWDDYGVLVVNERLPGAGLRDLWTRKYFNISHEQSWRPLATFSYLAQARIWGLNPFVFRLSNLLFHLLAGWLLFLLARANGLPARAGAAAACLFLIHPAHIETLMVASFNEEILVSVFLLGMLLAHDRHRLTGKISWAAAACLSFAAGLLSKEPALMGLPLLIISDGLRAGYHIRTPSLSERGAPGLRPGAGRAEIKRLWKTYTAYGAVLLVYIAFRFIWLRGSIESGGCSFTPPLAQRLFFAAKGWATALRVLILPTQLSIEYFPTTPDSGAAVAGWLLAGTGAAAGLLWLAWRMRRTDRPLAVFCLWPAFFLFPTSNLIPVCVLSLRYMAERWLYVPSLGLALLAGRFISPRPWLLVPILLLSVPLSLHRINDWTGEGHIWQSLARSYPLSARAHQGLGEALFREGRRDESYRAFMEALRLREERLDPVLRCVEKSAARPELLWDSPGLYRWLGHLALLKGRLAAGELAFRASLKLQPGHTLPHMMMGYYLAKARRFENAGAWVENGLKSEPANTFLLRLRKDIQNRRLTFKANFN